MDGFSKIIEQRIQKAIQEGRFKDLPGSGQPLDFQDDRHIPEDLRLAYKILKNADCVPPEIELKKEILRTEDLLANMGETTEKYRTLKKLNYLIMKFNTLREGSPVFDIPQKYAPKVTERLSPETKHPGKPAVSSRRK